LLSLGSGGGACRAGSCCADCAMCTNATARLPSSDRCAGVAHGMCDPSALYGDLVAQAGRGNGTVSNIELRVGRLTAG
jgi:hypothetical protein